jgi:flagellar motor switch protein FliG
MDALRKSAILVSTLERDLADAILNEMPGEEARQIRCMIMKLSNVGESDEHRAIAEFLGTNPLLSRSNGGNPCDELPLKIGRHREHDAASNDRALYDRLMETPAEVLVRLLSPEMPQTITAVLSQVPADRAAEIVSLLPSGMQVEILRRLIEFDQAAVLECEAIRQELDSWLIKSIDKEAERSQLIDRLSTFVSAASEPARSRLSANMAGQGDNGERPVSLAPAVGVDLTATAPGIDSAAQSSVASMAEERVVWS